MTPASRKSPKSLTCRSIIEVELDRVPMKIGALLELDVDSIIEMPRSAG